MESVQQHVFRSCHPPTFPPFILPFLEQHEKGQVVLAGNEGAIPRVANLVWPDSGGLGPYSRPLSATGALDATQALARVAQSRGKCSELRWVCTVSAETRDTVSVRESNLQRGALLDVAEFKIDELSDCKHEKLTLGNVNWSYWWPPPQPDGHADKEE